MLVKETSLWKKIVTIRKNSSEFPRPSFVQLFHLIDDFVSLAPVARRPIIIVHLIEDCRGLGYHKSGTNEPYKKYNTRPRLFVPFFFTFFSLFFVFFYTFFLFFFVFFFSFCFITDQRAARHISVLLLITRRCRVFFFRLATSVYESSGPGEGLRRGEGADPSISL